MQKRIPIGWIDLLVAMFLVLVFTSVGISQLERARETANRAKCASNLHQLGLGILLYQGDNQQLYPQVVFDKAADPKPVWGTPYQADPKIGPQTNVDPFGTASGAPAANDVSASLFLLLRNEQLTPAVCICPATNLKAWNFGGGRHSAQDWTNWDGNFGLARHLSYSYQNPFASKAAVASGFQMKNPDADFAVMADMNPGGDAVTSVTMKSTPEELKQANSLNHQREGQNVLYGDGHAEWQTTPFCGTKHDNIYTAAGPEISADGRDKAVIIASPATVNDSILLPTAADVGFKIQAASDSKPLSIDDRNKLAASIQGTYTAAEDGSEVSLTIDDKTIHFDAAGATMDYSYEPIGGSGNTLVAKLTNVETKSRERATIEFNDGELSITTLRADALDHPWKKTKPAGEK